MNMWRLTTVAALAVAIAAVACGGGDSAPPDLNPTEQAAADEEEIRSRLDEVGKAFSNEDWSGIYELMPPSARDECPVDRYLLVIDVGQELRQAAISDEDWETIKAEVADGVDVRSIEITGDIAIADTEETGEIELLREDGRWWVLDDGDPCEIATE